MRFVWRAMQGSLGGKDAPSVGLGEDGGGPWLEGEFKIMKTVDLWRIPAINRGVGGVPWGGGVPGDQKYGSKKEKVRQFSREKNSAFDRTHRDPGYIPRGGVKLPIQPPLPPPTNRGSADLKKKPKSLEAGAIRSRGAILPSVIGSVQGPGVPQEHPRVSNPRPFLVMGAGLLLCAKLSPPPPNLFGGEKLKIGVEEN